MHAVRSQEGSLSELRAELQEVLKALLALHAHEVSLDEIGEAIGARAVSTDEIDALFTALELRGRRITGPEGGGNEQRLKLVVEAARALVGELGRRPTAREVAERAGLELIQVQHALALLQVMQRR